ncbi:MAG TPA: glycosyltransferase [Bacteroidetes bacterium]|nr:glycosyltransferase [Bacteroidota bacterium]
MKRIICTVTNDLNFDQRMIRICCSLAGAGYEVLLVGRRLPHSSRLAKRPYKQKRFNLFFKKGKLFYVEYNIRLFAFLLFAKYDVVCSVDLDTLLPGFIISKIKRKKCVYDAHEYFTEVPELVERPIIKGIWEVIARWVVPRVKYACTVGECLANELEKKYGISFCVIRNVPLKKNFFIKKIKNNNPFILIYQGVLNEGRGLEEVIAAMNQLDGVELWLVGEGDLSGKLRQLAAKQNTKNKIVFHGYVLPENLHALTMRAHLGLNILKNKGLNYYYSLANKTFDYMQAGIPSVCMNFPEYKNIQKKYGAIVLVKDSTPSAIAHTVDYLKTNIRAYNQLCTESKRAAQQLIWEKEEKKLIAFYRNLIAD